MNRWNRPTGRCAAGALALAVLGGTRAEAQVVDLEPAWTDTVTGAMSQHSRVVIGAGGTRVAATRGADDELRFYSSFQSQGAPLGESLPDNSVHHQDLASAANSAHNAWYQLADPTGSGTYRVQVAGYLSSPDDPLWQFSMAADSVPLNGGVELSADGARVVVWQYRMGVMRTKLVVLDGNTGQQLAAHDVHTFGQPDRCEVSADGSVAVFRSSAKVTVVDTQSGNVLHGEGNSGGRGMAVSANGQVIALSHTTAGIRVYRRQGSSFALVGTFQPAAGMTSSELVFDADGSTLASVAIQPYTLDRLDLQVVDVQQSSLALKYSEVIQSTSSLQLNVSGLRISSAGDVVALAHWGDGPGGTLPELNVYGPRQGVWNKTAEHDYPGSIAYLDMSLDGTIVAVSRKAEHMNTLASGGSIDLFDLGSRRMEFDGSPSLGSTLTFRVKGRNQDNGHLIASEDLNVAPLTYPGVGTLYLQRGALEFSSRVTSQNDGWMTFQYTIPNDASLVGSQLHFQGLSLSPRSLTDELVTLTITD